MTATEETIVAEFEAAAKSCSYHHADDTGKEWDKAREYERKCQAMYDAADPELQAILRQIARGHLMTLRCRHGITLGTASHACSLD